MKLLVVSDYSWPSGGTEQFVCELLDRAARELDCRLLTWQPTAPTPPGFTGTLQVENGDVRDAWAAMDWADVFLVVTSFNVRLLARLAEDHLAVSRKPAVTVVQTSTHSNPRALARNAQEVWLTGLMLASHATVAVSEAVSVALDGLFDDAPRRPRIDVIENGARLSLPRAPAPRGRRRVSFIGRPHPQKGWPLYTRLADELRDSGLRFSANTVSISPAVHQDGIEYSLRLDDAALLAFFQSTDLLVVPYLYADGLPLALLEAINCGVPVLGFDSPAVAPLLRRHGQAVIPPNYEALAEAVEAWRTGLLDIPPPEPGRVQTWDEQIDRHLALLEEATGPG